MKSKLFKKGKTQSEDMALQITAMADIFTVLLVFLLKSYATSAIEVNPSQGMLLPQAHAEEAAVEALKLEVSEKAVSIEGKPIVDLEKYAFPAKDLQANGASDSLNKALDRERQKGMLIAKANSDVKVDGKIIIVADQRVPYSTIKSVLDSAALNGYTDFKLAVVKGD
jgi:biopolymer transport protein ExbD